MNSLVQIIWVGASF